MEEQRRWRPFLLRAPGRLRRRSASGSALAALSLGTIACLLYLQPPSGWLRRGAIHVAPDGFDGFIGHSRRFALRTIQRAVQLAEPGDTILIWPGIYREEVHWRRGGRPGRPVVLRSAVPGQAVISGGALPAVMEGWRWRPRGPHLWSTAVGWRVDGLRWRGLMAYRSNSTTHLRQICARPGAWPAFFSTARELMLCLPGGQRPASDALEVRRAMPARTRSGGHQVASLWIEAPYVEVRDLRFDFAVMAAIQLWNTHHVRLEGNLFDGADVAVNDNPALQPPRAIVVSRNFSRCYPLYEWARWGWLSWRELYRYSNCSLTWLRGADLEVSGNIVLQAGDAIKISPRAGSNRARNNLIVETSDDAFEFDGAARHLHVDDNLVFNAFVALAPSPVSPGPLMIRENTFLIFPFAPKRGHGVLLKLMGGPIRHVALRENIYLGYKIGHGDLDSPLSDVRIEANGLAILTDRNDGLAQADQIHWRANRYLRLSMSTWNEARQRPALLTSLGARPRRLGPIGPAWLDLQRDPVAAPLRPYLQSPWLARP